MPVRMRYENVSKNGKSLINTIKEISVIIMMSLYSVGVSVTCFVGISLYIKNYVRYIDVCLKLVLLQHLNMYYLYV